jgi:hypothetical protein
MTTPPSFPGQEPPTSPKVRKVPTGCLVVLAIPLGIFGIFRALAVIDSFSPFDIVRLYWNLVGAVIGLGIPYALFKVTRREPTEEDIQRATNVRGYTPYGCYATIGGFLLAMGIGATLSAVSNLIAGDTENALGFGTLGAMLTLVGAWFVVGGRVEVRREGPLRDALARNDPEPWRYAAQWAEGKARHTMHKSTFGLYLFALIWNAVAWPTALPILTGSDEPTRFIALILPGIGVLLVLAAIKSLRAGLTFGETVFTMETFPGTVGGRLTGVVQTRITPAMAQGVFFTATLRCARRTLRTNRDGPSHDIEPLWETSAKVPARVVRNARGETVALRIDLPIPPDVRPTTLNDASDCIVWFLDVAGNTSGTPFAAEMEVPIFDLRTAEERAAATPKLQQLDAEVRAKAAAPDRGIRAAFDPAITDATATPSLSKLIFPSPDARFAIDDQHGGLIRVTSESGDKMRSRIGMVLTAVGVIGLISIMRLPEGQAPDGIGLIPVGALFAGVFLWLVYYRYTKVELELRSTDLTVRARTMRHGESIFPYDTLAGAEVHMGTIRTTTRNGVVTRRIVEHDVTLMGKSGNRTWLGLRVTDRQQADWLVATIKERIARARAAAR